MQPVREPPRARRWRVWESMESRSHAITSRVHAALDLADLVRLQNRFMIGFDLALGSAALVAPRTTLRFFGHEEPSPEVLAGFRRPSWIWLTFAAAHANAERRGEPQDWWGGGAAGGAGGRGGAVWGV